MSKDLGPDKEPRNAEVRLMESALKVFSEKGYEAASIREIIDGAGVTRPVLYYYFQNKEDLYARIVDQKFSELTAAMERSIASSSSCKQRLKLIMASTFALAENDLGIIRLILQVFFAPPQSGPNLNRTHHLAPRRFKLMEEVCRQGLEREELSGGDARSLALIFQGLMDMHIMAKSDRPDTFLSPELADGLVEWFFAGAGYREVPKTNLVSPLVSHNPEPA
jgi:AcrR family transcriptional regulator